MIAFLLIALAGMFKAVADTLFHHYHDSIFKGLDQQWWNPSLSWKYVGFLPLTSYRPDAWHLSNTGMIVSFCCAVAFNDLYWHPLLQVGALGADFILVFNLFYNRILKHS